MKSYLAFLVFVACAAVSCREPSVPGLGEIMNTVQVHHAKLYYAGENSNWELAAYQLGEIQEGLDQAVEFHNHFKAVKQPLSELRRLTDPGLRGIEEAVAAHNKKNFLAAYDQLTAACNECHQATSHGFIVIQVPTGPMFSNQRFAADKIR